MVMSQLNIRPGVRRARRRAGPRSEECRRRHRQGDRRGSAADASTAITVTLAGQIETMRESFIGLFSGMGLAVVLVFLLMVINFQSWLDPLIVLMAVPFALAGVMLDALPDPHAHQRAGPDGHAHVHRPDHRQQHSGRDLRQPADGGRRRCAERRRSPRGILACGRC